MRRRIYRAIRHPLSPFKRRTLYSISILAAVLAVGTEGMHVLEGWSYVDSFYFISLIATTQGPTAAPSTDAGKIFASIMAFISVGSVLSSVAFVFGPVFGTVFKVGIDYVEKEKAMVRVPSELVPAIDHLIRTVKNDFNVPQFSSRAEVVTEAVKHLLTRTKAEQNKLRS